MQSFAAEAEHYGWRLDLYLAEVTGLSRSAAQTEIKAGRVLVNDLEGKPSYQLKQGDKVGWTSADPVPVEAPDLPILYEDEDVIAVDKPAGLLSHGVSMSRPEPSVAEFARGRVKDEDPLRPGIVHRLDKDTSGVMIIAKNAAAKTFLKQQFAEGKVKKTYLALVTGGLEPNEAIVRLPLSPSADHEKQIVKKDGKQAITRYKVKQYLPNYTLVEVHPQTGRTHQIRVHLAHLHHPVAGDTLYGSPKRPLGLARQFLHAAKLEIELPSGEVVTLTSDLPEDLRGFLDHLEKQYN